MQDFDYKRYSVKGKTPRRTYSLTENLEVHIQPGKHNKPTIFTRDKEKV